MEAAYKEEMESYVESAMQNIGRTIRGELELAFLTGVRVGMQEQKRIADRVFELWEQRNDVVHDSHH